MPTVFFKSWLIYIAKRANVIKVLCQDLFKILCLVFQPARKSILEMKNDHEEQVRRLKKLKDEEIDAVTSATSQTR